MNFENVNILQSRFGLKIISAQYFNKLDSHNYRVEDEEYPHPDLINARDALKKDLAKALYIIGEDMDNFTVNGFIIDEGDGITTVNITGQVTNAYDYKTNVKSGKIPLDEDQEDLILKIDLLKNELFQFFFNGKTAQGKLPGFPKTAVEEKAVMENNGEEEEEWDDELFPDEEEELPEEEFKEEAMSELPTNGEEK